MEGYLKKWINLIYRWQNRYFILHDGCLIYCLGKDKPKKGQIHLSICSIRQVVTDPLRIVINYGMNEIHLKASSIQEKQKWLDAFLKAQEKFTPTRRYSLLNQPQTQPFSILNGAPNISLSRIHTTLTKIWVTQAQLGEKLSLVKGPESQFLQNLSNELKDLVTVCAQQLDEEYKNLVTVAEKLQEKIRENNDINPPDHQDDLDDEIPDQQQNNHTVFESFNEDDDFYSVNDQIIHDERQVRSRPDQKRVSIKQEQTPLFNKQKSLMRQMSFIPEGSKSILEILDRLKIKQPIKYRNMVSNEAFKDMNISIEQSREFLPCFKDPNEKIRLFSVIKDMIGKDLSKITFPVTFNEPLSMLQNLCESYEYSAILDEANQQTESCLRLAYVMAFAVSPYSSTINRVKKPFNPLLGETYEFQNSEFRFLAEQVSHHPPISASFADNGNFECWTDNNVKTSFSGKSIEFTPISYVHVRLKKYEDYIHFQRSKSALRNIIIGTQYLENYGEINFTNRTTGDTGQLTLNERGWNGGGAYVLKGWVKDKNNILKYTIQGKWDSKITATQLSTKQEIALWNRNQLPSQFEQQFFFTRFAINLNHLNQQLLYSTPTTDVRLRPDQRALENGNVEIAAIEKTRLEQKQRQKRKEGHEQNAKWFKKDVDVITSTDMFTFNGKYWSERDKPSFHVQGLDIY